MEEIGRRRLGSVENRLLGMSCESDHLDAFLFTGYFQRLGYDLIHHLIPSLLFSSRVSHTFRVTMPA